VRHQANLSAGMSLNMLADLLLEFDAVEALNLDGGSSTTMVVQGKVVNKPSDQTGERPVKRCNIDFFQAKLSKNRCGRLLLHVLNSTLFSA
jgi:exopolysaccharide biosynthesis protein